MSRTLKALATCAVLFVSTQALALDKYLGTLTSTGTSVNNTTTAVPFTVTAGSRISFQCDTPVYVTEGSASSVVSTAATGLRVGDTAYALFDVVMPAAYAYAAIISASGTSNCKVFASVE